MKQEAFAKPHGIPLANIRQYEIGRTMPPLAVRAYLKVIDAKLEAAARALEMVGKMGVNSSNVSGIPTDRIRMSCLFPIECTVTKSQSLGHRLLNRS